ncbi:MAG: carbamoyl-phosphate synthase large subunit [Euryarchaeota archaeon]|nr:carbamoyl-phosphate synthase large subunit [Euryarchaeota archaeon]
MPKRTDIKKILVIGAGPIVIGQACEFDYSGSQACKALRKEGYKVVLVNSNPATIMTDPEMADKTYIEPLTFEFLEKIIEKEMPDALLPTLGGQTALNLAVELAEKGVLERFNVKLIGANLEAIKKAEDRILFKEAMIRIGIPVPKSQAAYSVNEAEAAASELGFPVVVRPAFTLGGSGGGIAYNLIELRNIAGTGIQRSRIGQVLIEESVIGWKEFELEVMRDINDNVVIICGIENFDPMGVHTGDSITVAPVQTLTDKEYQRLRNASLSIIREIGVETGGSNIQFAINPRDGRFVAIEMNPRVSRSSALASKATGYPIAKIAALLAIGMTLDEIKNDITGETPVSFEPSLDYVVVKIPRFTFEKFPEVSKALSTQMKSVGEVMAIGRTFEEALQKAVRSLETGKYGLMDKELLSLSEVTLKERLSIPAHDRLFVIAASLKKMSVEEVNRLTGIDPWFLNKIKGVVEMEDTLSGYTINNAPRRILMEAKRYGFSDRRLAQLLDSDEMKVREVRKRNGIIPVYKMVDTCAAEFEAKTPYFYSAYEYENEAFASANKKIAIIGAGPNRVGQGIEFDYCCVHACLALREMGIETIMINCNPETVSTDYDTSDRLYFEPLTLEDILNIVENEKPDGVILQLGGQTPLNLSKELADNGVKIIGTQQFSIDLAEDRQKFGAFLDRLKIPRPESAVAHSAHEAKGIANSIGYPLILRPSYVLGGRGMKVIFNENELAGYIDEAFKVSGHPVYMDRFLKNAIEIDVDAVCDGEDVFIAGIMEHIEEAGVHSGDAACVLPPQTLDNKTIALIIEYTKTIAIELKVIGLMNIQYAIENGVLHVLEVNPRASRTVPFVSKATGLSSVKVATKVMLGAKLRDMNLPDNDMKTKHISVKESVFPFIKLPGADTILGPEMKSTGEVMGIGECFGTAFYKAQLGAGMKLPERGAVFITVRDADKEKMISIAKGFNSLGFSLLATSGTSEALLAGGINVNIVPKIKEGRPNAIDLIQSRKIDLVINTTDNRNSTEDDLKIRRYALEYSIPYITTIQGVQAALEAIKSKNHIQVMSLQELYIR